MVIDAYSSGAPWLIASSRHLDGLDIDRQHPLTLLTFAAPADLPTPACSFLSRPLSLSRGPRPARVRRALRRACARFQLRGSAQWG